MDVEKIPDESFYVIIIEDDQADEGVRGANSVHVKQEVDCPSLTELSSVEAIKNEEDLENISNVKRELIDMFYGDGELEFQNLDDSDVTQLLYNNLEDQEFLSHENFEDEQSSENEHYSFTDDYRSSEEDHEFIDEKSDEDFEAKDDDDSQSADEKEKIYSKRRMKKSHSIVSDLYKKNPELRNNNDALIQTLVQIMRSQKPCKLPQNSYIALGSGEYMCSRCAKSFHSLASCRSHYQEKHGLKYLKCLACSRAYRSKWTLYRHEKVCRAPHAQLVLRARGYFLGNKGQNRPFLQREVPFVRNDNEDPNSNSLSCSMCTASFQSKVALQSHERSHRGERPFQCELCARAYTSISALMRHQNSHEEPKYMCTICARKFKQKDTLVTHMYTHSGVKRFACSECPRRYSTNHALKLHVRAAHLNLPPPCACKLCSKRFRRMSVLNNHMQKEHGVRIVTRKMFFKRLPLLSDMKVEKAKLVLAREQEENIEDSLLSE